MIRFVCIIGLLLFHSVCEGQSLRTYINRDTLSVGDEFKLYVTIDRNSRFIQTTPPDSTVWGNAFELKRMERISRGNIDSLIFHLQFFATNDTVLAPKRFRLSNANDIIYLTTPEVPLFFHSVLDAGNTELKPLKPIFLFAASLLPWLLLLLIVAAVSYLIWRYSKRPAKPKETVAPVVIEPRIFINPITVLEKRLEEIEHSDFIKSGSFKVFYSELADALRTYFEQVYDVAALEMSTTEIKKLIKSRNIHQELQKFSIELLQDADLVKFAKFTPSVPQAKSSMSIAWNFCKLARNLDRERIHKARMAYEEEFLSEAASSSEIIETENQIHQ